MYQKGKLLFEETTREIIGGFYRVYNNLGYGFLEAVYQKALMSELRRRGLSCQCEVAFPIYYEGELVGEYRADLVVNRKIIVETNAVPQLRLVHDYQIVNYLKASKLQVGLILNFGPTANYLRFIQTTR